MIRTSSVVNVSQLVGTLDGQCLVPTYNWSDYLDEHTLKTALKGIKKNHHFKFTSHSPGAVFVRKTSGDDEKEIQLLKDPTWKPSYHNLLDLVIPQGLSVERQWYLYEKSENSSLMARTLSVQSHCKHYHNMLYNLFIHLFSN